MRLFLSLLLCLTVCACTTRKQAKAEAQKAFMAGHQEAIRKMQQATASNVVTIYGPVRTPEVAWSPGLTLSQAIIAAEYTGPRDPTEILLVRAGVAYRYEPAQLLSGRDIPVMAGDIIQLNLQSVPSARPAQR